MKMKWLLVAGSISCLGACPSTTVGEGEGDVVAGEGEGDAAEGEGDGSAEGEGDVGEGEGEGDAGEGEGDSGEGEGEGEGEPPLCADPLHNGGDGSCVPLRECSGGFAIYEATDSCSAWKKAPEFAFNEFLNTTLFVHQNDIYFSTGDEAGGHLFRTRLQDGTLTPYVDVTLPANGDGGFAAAVVEDDVYAIGGITDVAAADILHGVFTATSASIDRPIEERRRS